MSKTPRETVNEMFAAFGSQNLESALRTVSDNTLWIHHGTTRLPAMRFVGKSGAEKFFQTGFTAMQVDYFRPLSYIEQGNTVVVLGEEAFTMAGIEGKVFNKWVQVYTVENELITRMEEFGTSARDADYNIVT